MSIAIDTEVLTGAGAQTNHAERRLRIATHADSPHLFAISAAGHIPVELPHRPDEHFNRSVQQRIEDGRVYRAFLESNPADLIFDVETSALSFVPETDGNESALALTNVSLGIPLVAHFIDPVTETMKQMDWGLRWQLLEHPGWIKWIWDDAHARELRRLGAANVLSMPMGADLMPVSTDPVPAHPPGAPIGFVGHPATSWFKGESCRPADTRIGLIAAAAKADDDSLTFADIYYDLYRFDSPPNPSDAPAHRAQKSADYFTAKFHYNVFLAVKQRDRFAHFLKNNLNEQFELIGDYWSDCCGLSHKPAIRDRAALMQTYRDTAICVNLFKGNAETGLNLRHYEVTAAGGFLLSYDMPELARQFEIGKECVVFRNERELLDKVRYYLAHPNERIEIAMAGQRRTLSEHLYSHRFAKLVEDLGLQRTPERPKEVCT